MKKSKFTDSQITTAIKAYSRRYGAILAKLKFNDFPDLIKRSSENHDQDIQNFVVNFLNEKKFTD